MTKPRKNKTKITDWIQAIAAAISIPAAIFAFFTFFQKDEALQSQIADLDTISRQSIIQTKILAKQVEILREEQDFLKQQNDITLTHRKTEIEPKLILEFESYDGDVITAKLINNGKSARILKVIENKNNEFVIDIPYEYIGEGKEKRIYFKFKNPRERNENTALDFTIVYEDIDRKTHSKEYKYKDLEKIINKGQPITYG